MRTKRELNIFQRNNRSREGENPASRISFSHAGENHVHAVNKGENPASRTLSMRFGATRRFSNLTLG